MELHPPKVAPSPQKFGMGFAQMAEVRFLKQNTNYDAFAGVDFGKIMFIKLLIEAVLPRSQWQLLRVYEARQGHE